MAAKRVSKARAPRARKMAPVTASTWEVARGIARYLDECRSDTRGQKPMARRSPEKIMESIERHEARIASGKLGTIAELTERNTILELQRSLKNASNGDAKEFFVVHAAEFAGRKGISASAFRAMGVPASVVKEAGIQ